MRIHELKNNNKIKIAREFVSWACEKLDINDTPSIQFSDDKDQVKQKRTFGTTLPTGEIWVYVGERNTADMLRTLVHELVHVKQFGIGSASDNMSEKQRLRIEDQANAIAGRLMREYGKRNVDIYEGRDDGIQPSVAAALPATYSIPELKNQDPYLQYRFGVAIAGAKGAKKREEDGVKPYKKESPWGENEIVVSFDPDIHKYIDDALNQMGLRGKKRLSTLKSEETADVDKKSPMQAFKGYKRK